MKAKIARGGLELWSFVSILFLPFALLFIWNVVTTDKDTLNVVVFCCLGGAFLLPGIYTVFFCIKAVSVSESGITKHRLFATRDVSVPFSELKAVHVQKHKPQPINSVNASRVLVGVLDREHTEAVVFYVNGESDTFILKSEDAWQFKSEVYERARAAMEKNATREE